jgi:hypothetical protein
MAGLPEPPSAHHDLATSVYQFRQPFVQLDNSLRPAIEKLLDCEVAARVRLIAIIEAATAAGTGPEGFRLSALHLVFPQVQRLFGPLPAQTGQLSSDDSGEAVPPRWFPGTLSGGPGETIYFLRYSIRNAFAFGSLGFG